MKRSKRQWSVKSLIAAAAVLSMGISVLMNRWILPSIPVAAEETGQTEEEPDTGVSAENSENPQEAEQQTESDQTESDRTESAETQSEDSPEEIDDSQQEDLEVAPAESASEGPVQNTPEVLTVGTDSFTLTLKPEDETEWQAALQAYPGIELELKESDGDEAQQSDSSILLLHRMYTVQFTENGTQIDLGHLVFKASLELKTDELANLYEQISVMNPEESEEGISMKLDSELLSEPLSRFYTAHGTEIQPADNAVSEPIQFSIAPGQSFELLAEVPNPSFTVQYYVNYSPLTKSAQQTENKDTKIAVIDSSAKGYGAESDNNGKGGVIPSNGQNPKLVYLDLQRSGSNATFKQTETIAPFYDQEVFKYHEAPNPHYLFCKYIPV